METYFTNDNGTEYLCITPIGGQPLRYRYALIAFEADGSARFTSWASYNQKDAFRTKSIVHEDYRLALYRALSMSGFVSTGQGL